MKRKLIRVIQDDIANGVASNCEQCPIALALRRLGLRPRVYRGYVGWPDHHYEGSNLPRKAREFIALFDQGYDVAPFNFYLEVPS